MRSVLRSLWFFWLCILIALIGTWYTLRTDYSKTPALDVWVLSVGQGESILLREASGRKILFDGGPDDSVLSELSGILPFWDHHIDMLILSHNHADHLHGLNLVLARYTVDEVITSGALDTTAEFYQWQAELKEKHPTIHVVRAGYTETFGTLFLKVYHPVISEDGLTPEDQHDATVVVKVTYGHESILLTGDLNTGHEQDIIAYCHPPSCSLGAQVLQVPHHGSATGLSPAFLAAVNPQVAVICVGQNNIFHHPRPNILAELSDAKIPYYRTDQDGEVHFILTKDHLTYARVAGSVPR